MKTNIYNTSATLLTIVLLFGTAQSSMAANFTALTNGNWSSASTWMGNCPGFVITGANTVIIPLGLRVVLDSNLMVNNSLATIEVLGSLTSDADVTIAAGTLSGTGTTELNGLVIGASGFITSLGNIIVNRFTNSQAALVLNNTLYVNNALVLNPGAVQLNTGSSVILANNGTLNMAGGSLGMEGGILYVAGSYNLLYSCSATKIGGEAYLSNLQNVTVNLSNTKGQINLTANLSVAGLLALQNGTLGLNAHNLIVNGGFNTAASACIAGDKSSNLIINGKGKVGTFTFLTGFETIKNLTINIGATGSVILNSNVTIGGTLTLAQGNLVTGNHDVTIAATGNVEGGSSLAYVTTNGSGSLMMTIANAGGTGTFPVGTLASYAPMVITSHSVTSASYGVNAHKGVMANGLSGANIPTIQSAVNTGWEVSSSLTSGANVNLEMFWNSGMQVNGFDNAQASVSHYTGGQWNGAAPSKAKSLGGGIFSQTLSGVTSFSPFAVFDKNTATTASAVKSESPFHVYPASAVDMLQVSVTEPTSNPVFKIVDATGKEISSQRLVNAFTWVDVSKLAPGSYTASLNNKTTKQFVKE